MGDDFTLTQAYFNLRCGSYALLSHLLCPAPCGFVMFSVFMNTSNMLLYNFACC